MGSGQTGQFVQLLFVGIALAYAAGVSGGLNDVNEESAMAMLLAQSLAAGHGYRSVWEPGSPLHAGMPCGLPLLLTPIVAWRGLDLWMIQLFMAAVSIAAMASFWLLLGVAGACRGSPTRRSSPLLRSSEGAKESSCALASASAPFLTLAGTAVLPSITLIAAEASPEMPYLLLSVLALVGIERYCLAGHSSSRWLWWAAFASSAACLVRPIGVALLFGGVARLVVAGCAEQRPGPVIRLKQAGWFIAVWAAAPVLWAWRGWRVFGLAGFPDALNAVGELGRDLGAYAALLGRSLLFVPSPLEPVIGWVRWLALATVLVGWCSRMLRVRSALEYYTIGYVTLLALQVGRGAQELVGLLPIAVYYLIEGAVATRGWLQRFQHPDSILRLTGIALAAFWLGANALASASIISAKRSGRFLAPEERRFVEVHRWAAEHLPQHVVIASARPAVSAIIARRPSVAVGSADQLDDMLRQLAQLGATHVAVDELPAAPARIDVSLIEASGEHFRLLVESGQTRLYEMVR